jgi:hypothetical protein
MVLTETEKREAREGDGVEDEEVGERRGERAEEEEEEQKGKIVETNQEERWETIV